jgi:tetratricopeptide (TPR) repeat protein
MDLHFQGLACFNRGLTPDNVAQARRFFDRALSADPGNVDALAASGVADTTGGVSGFASDPQAAFAAAEAKLTKALSLAPDHALAHVGLGFLYLVTKRAALGIAECEHALELDRNFALAHGNMGLGKLYVGRAEETEGHCVEALRLSPRDAFAYVWMFITGAAKLYLGADDQAVGWLRRSVESNRNYPPIHFHLGAALAHLGRLDEARSAVKAGLALHPKFSISFARVVVTAVSDHPIYLAGYERLLEGLRKAGLPEE